MAKGKKQRKSTAKRKLTLKQDAFACAFIENGGNASEAYRVVYGVKNSKPATVNRTAKGLTDNPKIAARIAQLRKKHSKTHDLNVSNIIEELEEARQIALNPPMYSTTAAAAAVNATMSKAKLLGLDKVPERQEQGRAFQYVGIPSHLVGPSFGHFIHDVRDNAAIHFWHKGGRGSLKSTTISLAFIDKLVNNPDMHGVVLRDVFSTLKDSAYSQLIWAIDQLGLADFFSAKVSPLQITYNPTGQTIFFRGLDDPLKLKSIKPKFGYVGLIWFEEVAEIDGMDTIRSVLQSLMRGGEVFSCFYSYNPPKSKNNWVNVAVDEEALRPDTKVYHSDYTTVPRKWLGEPFLLQAEVLKEANPKAYEHEYLGIATGSGGDVFDNVVIEKILDEDIAVLGAIRNGVDFGFAVDPFVFGRCGYNRLYDTLYIFDEFYQTKVHDDVAAKKIKERGITTEPVFCDSADPKGIDNLKREGVNALGSTKFPGSREYGYKFLQRWARIVIDQARCPNAKREFTACEYERDKDGNFLSVIPKRNDHTIDKVRYALDREIANTRPTTYSTASSR